MVMHAHQNRETLETLLRMYWLPIFVCIRRRGYTEHDASDLTQEFMTTVVIGRALTSHASPTRGRFRTFIRAALGNFLIDQHRAGRSSRRSLSRSPSRSAATSDFSPAHDAPSPDYQLDAEFDRQWAAAVLHQAIEHVRDECESEGMSTHWEAFEAVVVLPTTRRVTPPALADVVARLHTSGPLDATRVSNMVQTVKRKFRRVLREIVAQTVENSNEVENEIADLRAMIDSRR